MRRLIATALTALGLSTAAYAGPLPPPPAASPLPLAQGGTGGTTQATAQNALGLGAANTANGWVLGDGNGYVPVANLPPASATIAGVAKLNAAGGAAPYNLYSGASAGSFTSGSYLLGSNGTANYAYSWANFLRGQYGEGIAAFAFQPASYAVTGTAQGSSRMDLGMFMGSTYNALSFNIFPDAVISDTTTGTAASAATAVTLASVNGVFVGQTVTGTGVPTGDQVTSMFGALTLSSATTAAMVNVPIDFTSSVSTTATWASAASTITVASATGLYVGAKITGTGLAANTLITSISGTTVGVSIPTTAAAASSTAVLAVTFTQAVANAASGATAVTLNTSVAINPGQTVAVMDPNVSTAIPSGDTVSAITGGVNLKTATTAALSATSLVFASNSAGTLIHEQGVGATIAGTDQTAAIAQAVQTIAAAGGGTLFFPQGSYLFNDASTITVPSNVHIMGAGRTTTAFLNRDDTGGTMFGSQCGGKNFEFSDFSIRGTLDIGQNSAGAKGMSLGCFSAWSYDLTVHNVGFLYNRNETISAERFRRVDFSHNRIYVSNGGPGFGDSDNVDIGFNYIRFTGDDAGGCHSYDGDVVPARSTCNIHDNIFEDTQGIDSQGSKTSVIHHNVFKRMVSYAAVIGQTPGTSAGEGNVGSENDNLFTDNIVDTVLQSTGLSRNQTHVGLVITCALKAAGNATVYPGDSSNSVPGTPDSVGNITPLYGAVNTTITSPMDKSSAVGSMNSGNDAQLGCTRPDVRGNHFFRSKASVPAPSVWGYDTDGDAQGTWDIDHEAASGSAGYSVTKAWNTYPIQESDLTFIGISETGPMRHGVIAENEFNTGGPAVVFANYSTIASNDYDGLLIHHNIFANCGSTAGGATSLVGGSTNNAAGCLRFEAGSVSNNTNYQTVTYQHVIVSDNICDADDQFVARGGGASSGGAWASTAVLPCFYAPYISGVQWLRNDISDVMFPIVPASTAANVASTASAITVQDTYSHNVLHGLFAATGFSTSNLGIGTVPAAGAGYDFIWEQSNPTIPATYKMPLFAPYTEAAAMPTTGYWLPGQRIANAAPGVGKPLDWVRLSYATPSGGTYVLGTDWAAEGATGMITPQTGAYTFTPGDCGTAVRDKGATAAHTYTIPTGLPIGCQIEAVQETSYAISIAAASGVAIEALSGATTTGGVGAHAVVKMLDTATANVHP